MRNTVRIYGNTLQTWKYEREAGGAPVLRQVEVAYTEYDTETGEVVGVGSEDFSAERFGTLITKLVWGWDGEKRNAGNKRWFDYIGSVTYTKGTGKAVKELLGKRRSEFREFQLR